MALYSETVMDHFRHPRNVGVIENADGVGEVGNAKCGDIMKIYLKIENDTISDVKFETFGCASAIASSSMATELIKGKPVSEAMTLTNQAVAEALEGLPAHKLHCSVLAEEAIQKALEDYAQRSGTRVRYPPPPDCGADTSGTLSSPRGLPRQERTGSHFVGSIPSPWDGRQKRWAAVAPETACGRSSGDEPPCRRAFLTS